MTSGCFQCIGGPHHEKIFDFPHPIPKVVVWATHPPLRFHEYERVGDSNKYSWIGER